MEKKTSVVNKQFLDMFAQLEDFLAANFSGDNNSERLNAAFNEAKFIRKVDQLGLTRDDLHNLRQLRNILIHQPNYLKLSTRALTDLNKLVLTFCKQAIDLATPSDNIYAANSKTAVLEIIQTMDRNKYGYVPVINNNQFIGLFTKNVVLKLTAQEKLSKNILIGDILNLLEQENTENTYEFLRTTAAAEKAYSLFSRYIEQGKHLGVILLTDSGKKSSKIKGLITAWDLYKLVKTKKS